MTQSTAKKKAAKAEIVREYGPFPGKGHVRGVTFDGSSVWFAAGESIESFDPDTGAASKSVTVRAEAGTAFDGTYLYQLNGDEILRVDPTTGAIVGKLAAPGTGHSAGLTWAEGALWVARHDERKIYRIEATTGRVLSTVDSPRFVTGVTFVDGELWHGTWENDESELRRVDPETGETIEVLSMPEGVFVTGLESDGKDLFYCGGGPSGKVRAVKRPKRARA